MSEKLEEILGYFSDSLEFNSTILKILLGIIIFNFIIIIWLSFQINSTNKFKKIYNIKNIKDDIKNLKSTLIIIYNPSEIIDYYYPTIKVLKHFKVNLKVLCIFKDENKLIYENSKDNKDNKDNIDKQKEQFYEFSKLNLKMEDNQIINLSKDEYTKEIINKKIRIYLDENKDIDTIISVNENFMDYDNFVYFIRNNKQFIKDRNINIYLLDYLNTFILYTPLFPFLFFFVKEYGFLNFNFWILFKKSLEFKKIKNYKRINLILVTIKTFLRTLFCSYSYVNPLTKVEIKL